MCHVTIGIIQHEKTHVLYQTFTQKKKKKGGWDNPDDAIRAMYTYFMSMEANGRTLAVYELEQKNVIVLFYLRSKMKMRA